MSAMTQEQKDGAAAAGRDAAKGALDFIRGRWLAEGGLRIAAGEVHYSGDPAWKIYRQHAVLAAQQALNQGM
jgi:hypothetical protein